MGPCPATNCAAALKAVDGDGTVIGSGANHVLLSQYFDNCDKTFQELHKQQLQYLNRDEKDVTRYFLCGMKFFQEFQFVDCCGLYCWKQH